MENNMQNTENNNMQNNNSSNITANYDFLMFASEQGKKQVEAGEFTNKKTGEPFVALVFPAILVEDEEGKKRSLLVSVSSNCGKFTTKEELNAFVLQHKKELQIVQIDNPEYSHPLFSLCYKAHNTMKVVGLFD